VTEAVRICTDSLLNRVYVVGGFADSLVVGGFKLTSRGDLDGFVLALTIDLQPIWLKQLGGPGRDVVVSAKAWQGLGVVLAAYCGANTQSVTTYTVGSVTYSGRGEADPVVALMNTDGSVAWSRNDGGPNPDFPTEVEIAQNSIPSGTRIHVTGGFSKSTRLDTQVFGDTATLPSAYIQTLQIDGHQRDAAAATAIEHEQEQSRATFKGLAYHTDDVTEIVLRFQGSVVWGYDTLKRISTDEQEQVLLTYGGRPSGFRIVRVCLDEASAWNPALGQGYGVYDNRKEYCDSRDPESLYWVPYSQNDRRPLAWGNNDVIRVVGQAGRVFVVGSCRDTCILWRDGPPQFAYNTNGNTDGLVILSDDEGVGREVFLLKSSITAEVQDAGLLSSGFVIAARAQGTVGIIPGTPTVTADQQLVMCFTDPAVSVGLDHDPTDWSLHNPFAAEDVLDVLDLAGNEVSPKPLTLPELGQLPPGTYILRSGNRLSLCHVGTHYISFPISSATPR
jgi:hypothetical protein